VAATPRSDEPLRKFFPFIIASDIAILACVAVIGFTAPDRWNGAYLALGILVGVVGVVLYLGFLASLRRTLAKAGRDASSLRDRMRWRNRIVLPGFLVFGAAWGALSAIFDTPLFVVLYAVLILVMCLVPYLLFPRIVRRLRPPS
jgi:hypothetical protein